MTEFRIGEIVDITIKGVRIARPRSATSVTISDKYDIAYQMPPQAAIERVAPAEWPPRPGDLWRDVGGMLYLGQQRFDAASDGIDLIDTAGDAVPQDFLMDRFPTLVHREGNQS